MAGLVEALGVIGPINLALCGLPQAIQVVRQGHARGMGWPFLLLWFSGEIFTLVFVVATMPNQWALIGNYAANSALIGVMCWFRMAPRVSHT